MGYTHVCYVQCTWMVYLFTLPIVPLGRSREWGMFSGHPDGLPPHSVPGWCLSKLRQNLARGGRSMSQTERENSTTHSPLLERSLMDASFSWHRVREIRYNSIWKQYITNNDSGLVSVSSSPGEILRSLPMALLQTSPLTPGGSPSHHSSLTLLLLLLEVESDTVQWRADTTLTVTCSLTCSPSLAGSSATLEVSQPPPCLSVASVSPSAQSPLPSAALK